MYPIFLDALTDTLKMVPLLLIIYIGIEFMEYKFGNKIREKIQRAGTAGPAIGSVAGCLPQCGVSVVTTALYTQRLVTVGTLIAVYLSTSDEAIPIILSQPASVKMVVPLILTKVIIALMGGYFIDFIFRKINQPTLAHIEAYAQGKDDRQHHHEVIIEELACCEHSTSASSKKFSPKEIFLHPLVHTLKIFLFIFAVSFLINMVVTEIGNQELGVLFLGHSFFQPFLAALVGLIPNCAASVAITEIYLKGLITYGSLIAGLCASGGLGILVLVREEKNKNQIVKILTIHYCISVLAGEVIQYFL